MASRCLGEIDCQTELSGSLLVDSFREHNESFCSMSAVMLGPSLFQFTFTADSLSFSEAGRLHSIGY